VPLLRRQVGAGGGFVFGQAAAQRPEHSFTGRDNDNA
jgi:hypothetical protein